jgi:hypothetical protein
MSNRDPFDLLCVRVRTALAGVFNAFSKVQPFLTKSAENNVIA